MRKMKNGTLTLEHKISTVPFESKRPPAPELTRPRRMLHCYLSRTTPPPPCCLIPAESFTRWTRQEDLVLLMCGTTACSQEGSTLSESKSPTHTHSLCSSNPTFPHKSPVLLQPSEAERTQLAACERLDCFSLVVNEGDRRLGLVKEKGEHTYSFFFSLVQRQIFNI